MDATALHGPRGEAARLAEQDGPRDRPRDLRPRTASRYDVEDTVVPHREEVSHHPADRDRHPLPAPAGRAQRLRVLRQGRRRRLPQPQPAGAAAEAAGDAVRRRETNLAELSARAWTARRPPSPEIRRIDPLDKREEREPLHDAAPPPRSAPQPGGAARGRAPTGGRCCAGSCRRSAAEMESRLRAALRGRDRFVTASGEIDSRAYRAVLRAGGWSPSRARERRYSGLYYVTRVRPHVHGRGLHPALRGLPQRARARRGRRALRRAGAAAAAAGRGAARR